MDKLKIKKSLEKFIHKIGERKIKLNQLTHDQSVLYFIIFCCYSCFRQKVCWLIYIYIYNNNI